MSDLRYTFDSKIKEEIELFSLRKSWGRIVDLDRSGGVLRKGAAKAIEVCAREHQRYQVSRPLHYVMLHRNGSQKANAYAIWLDSVDVVATTSAIPIYAELFALMGSRMVMGDIAIDNQNGKMSPLKRLGFSRPSKSIACCLRELFFDGILNFIVGHEIGHLACGHLPLLRKCTGNFGDNAAIDELSMGGIADASPAADLSAKSVLLPAIEFDADAQGIYLLDSYWTSLAQEGLPEAGNCIVSENDYIQLRSRVLSNENSRAFVSAFCVAAAMAIIGLPRFNIEFMVGKTHPASILRLQNIFSLIPAVCHKRGVDSRFFLGNSIFDAVVVMAAVLGNIVTNEKSGVSLDVRRLFIAARTRHQRISLVLSLIGFFDVWGCESGEKTAQLMTEVYKILASSQKERASHKRWSVVELLCDH